MDDVIHVHFAALPSPLSPRALVEWTIGRLGEPGRVRAQRMRGPAGMARLRMSRPCQWAGVGGGGGRRAAFPKWARPAKKKAAASGMRTRATGGAAGVRGDAAISLPSRRCVASPGPGGAAYPRHLGGT